jgi:predicted nucleic acid-binding protein
LIFDNLASGHPVYLDAKHLRFYQLSADPKFGPACNQLLKRIEAHDLQGFTSTHILSEVAHRLMTTEASAVFGWPFAGIVYRLQKHLAEVQRLTAFRLAVDRILHSAIRTVTIPPALILAAAAVSRQTGLLTNDALVVAVMQQHGLTNLASNDAGFDRVPGLARYAPA